jgi:cytochrome b
VLAVTLVLMTRRRTEGRAVMVVAILAVVAAGVAAGVVARVGHLGSTAVWSCTIGSDACK